ncbi:uncharacterized protein KGF55_002642 [Candida pseudojiufengensis]|uniref:uncharacterized protein n=1 Tax=Candida pseudojiufengensis TaxID=497109 RepID=UPI002223FB55|nr:uncharacterized protein KGF55_002642 [Candida pseudojiufengensis]KAI5963762.1 hypothetical protein KGF55_002642 [Candida pseudojiufengensis]
MTNSGVVTPHSRPGTPSGLINSPPLQLNSTSNINSSQLQVPNNLSNLSTQPTSTTSSVVSSNKQQQQQHVPSYEKPIYEQLFSIYKSLLDLKNNRNKYINSKQVYSIYDLFLNVINDLKLTRKDEELKGITLNLPNGNDLIIDDIFQLLSLCFVTCGLIKFAPATYSSLSAVMKLLTHLKECKVYTMDDLKPVGVRLNEIKNILINSNNQFENDNDDEDEEDYKMSRNHQIEETLLRNKLNKCENLYAQLVDNFKNIPSDLEPIYHELIKIRANLLNFVTQEDSKTISNEKLNDKINQFKLNLKNIEKLRDEIDGKFHSQQIQNDENKLDSIQAILNGLIDDCNNLIADLMIHDEEINLKNLNINDEKPNIEVSSDLKIQYDYIYKTLQNLKLTLDNLLVTRRWTLRETDLYTYQKTLKSIDEQRIKIVEQTPKGTFKKYQTLILYLLRRCYSIIYKLLESSEPVSESLTPIHNQLQTVKRCLLELKRVDGVNNLRELYPFQFKLASIDNLKKDGKFIVDRTVPEGQGALCALLSECFDIIQEMKIELEEKELEEEEEEENEENAKINENELNSLNSSQNHNGTTNGSLVSKIANGGSFTNSKEVSGSGGIDEIDDVEIKRNRFQEFNEADYDLESESAFDDDDDQISDSEFEGNDYY